MQCPILRVKVRSSIRVAGVEFGVRPLLGAVEASVGWMRVVDGRCSGHRLVTSLTWCGRDFYIALSHRRRLHEQFATLSHDLRPTERRPCQRLHDPLLLGLPTRSSCHALGSPTNF